MKKILSPPRAISFDAGNTLLEASTAPVEVYHQSAQRLGAKSHSPDELWQVMGPHMRTLFETRAKEAGASNDEIELEFWSALLKHIIENFKPCSELSLDLWLKDLRSWFSSTKAWQLYPESISTLEALKNKGVRLALISNWDSSLVKILDDLKVSPYFECIHISAIIGWRKPNPKIFELTCQAMNLAPEEICHVGDNISDDIVGAQNFGMSSLFVDRWNYEEDVNAPRVKSLDEIISIYWDP